MTSARSSATSAPRTRARPTRSRSTATSTWSTTAATCSTKDGLKPPETWDDYLAIAKKYNGQDLNGDGTNDYGSCISKKRNAQAYWFITSIAGGYIQTTGTNQGAFFSTDDMKPLIQNDAFAAALDVYKDTGQYGPPDEINQDVGDTRGNFTSGRCALSMDWGDIGTLAIDPTTSKVAGQGRRRDPARQQEGARPRDRQARAPATPRPARTRSTASTTPRSPRSAAGPARSTARSTRRSRTRPTPSCPTSARLSSPTWT